MEPMADSFETFIEYYVELWSVFATFFLPGPASLPGQDRKRRQRAIPPRLQAVCRLLQLPAEASLAEVHTRYRELAKRYHPDAGGSHADFLALQQAYKQVIAYLQTRS